MNEEPKEKCECGMPLDDKTRCKCEPQKCIHCCTCDENCECGCKEKAAASASEESEVPKEE